MKAFEARNILDHVPDDTEVTLVIGKLLDYGQRGGDSSGFMSGYVSSQPHDDSPHGRYGPYGQGVSQDDR